MKEDVLAKHDTKHETEKKTFGIGCICVRGMRLNNTLEISLVKA